MTGAPANPPSNAADDGDVTGPPPRDERVRPAEFGWKSGVFRSRLWAWSWVLWTAFYMLPIASGLLLKVAFDRLDSSESITSLLVGIGITEVARWITFAAAIWFVVRWWIAALTQLRSNMLRAQTVSGGPHAARLPGSPSEAITRFADDANDAVLWVDSWLDGAAMAAYALTALIIMATINVQASLIVLLPLAAVTVIARLLTPRLYAARAADRAAGSQVNSFLGEMFAGMLAFRLAGKEGPAVQRLEVHTARRRQTAVRDTVLDQTIRGISSSSSDVAIGLALLVLVPSVRRGDFGVGDLALFVTYVAQLGELPRFVARVITSREQAIVAYGRMGELVAREEIGDLFAPTEVTIERDEEMRRPEPDPARRPLEQLRVSGLTRRYASTGGGIDEIDLTVERGSFTVVTGGVGAGKSTLLRAIAGLVETDAGSVRWNGESVDDPAAWFVPPQSALLPQVPRLFSESLTANITLGRSQERLDEVLDVVRLTADLAEMPDGAATTVGARGLRLSGGQLQRVATARSLLTAPELLLIDDVSSALDVTTETELWDRLVADGSSTVIAVSHRQLAFDRADQIITLEAGRVVDVVRRAPEAD